MSPDDRPRYLQIVGRYEREEVERFAQMLAILTDWMECGFGDCLGQLFMALELGDEFKGQFFTPYEVARMMAMMTMGDVRPQIELDGFISVGDPACGAGGMVIACAEALREQGINYQQAMHVTAIDIDATAVHMAYLQLVLLHVPAIVIHGNSLSCEDWGHWVTPAHVLGGWDRRLRAWHASQAAGEQLAATAADLQPQPRTGDPQPRIAAAEEEPGLAKVRARVIQQRVDQLTLFE